MKYINIVGGAGAGKSVFSQEVSEKLGLRYIDLDAVNWQKNWKMMPSHEFKDTVAKLLDENADKGWVADGLYHHRLDNSLVERADTLLLLKIPLYITLPRVIWRSCSRIASGRVLWGTNKETIGSAVVLWWWTIKFHRKRIRRVHQIAQELPELEVLIFISNAQARRWLDSVN